ncbi:DUF2219 domain-containing protein [Pseudooceanicola sp.]|uniref:DUF2219 domain-containing protein n=1 Tax=Pseudooceanicola sp. TaxID=1914328 RepID=UPI0035C74794
MRRLFLALLLTLTAASVQAEGWSRIGHGRLTVNDLFGDRIDRWRTGSVAASYVFGPEWTGRLPAMPGQILEFRILGEVIAPVRLDLPWAMDRPYSQALSLGLHTHFDRGGWQMALGADAVITGPQTGLSDFQMFLHRITRFDHMLHPAVAAAQTPNGVHGSGVFEIGRELGLGAAVLRPYAELRVGVEDLARIGFDLSFGPVGRGELLVRDPVTGHRYRTITRRDQGMSLVVGADVAKVWESLHLPAATNTLTEARYRLRGGIHWQGKKWAGFYGLTWLGPEFVGQSEGQLVGALRLQVRF